MAAMIKGFKWVRPFTIERWVDGDTVIGLIDRGDGDYYRPAKGIRLLRRDGTKFDAPEMHQDPERAIAARQAAAALAGQGEVVISTSHMLDVYGRPLCSLALLDGRDIATELIAQGHLKLALAAAVGLSDD